MHDDPRRRTPSAHQVLTAPELAPALETHGRDRVKDVLGIVLEQCRTGDLEPADVTGSLLDRLAEPLGSLRPVVNATGIVVHTNLGRAPLSVAAVEALARASGTTDVELDLTTGRRGPRGAGAIAALTRAVPAAGGAHVVNNGAAALALVACALAADREIVVARGEMVEIGDGFRIPDLLESTGARLREVGTTNRVRLDDYAAAISERTGFVLKVHPSNFRVEGFTSSVDVAELATLPVPVVADIGSGLLRPHPRLPDEPDATTSLERGASLVTASGDKLLGGPQCGLLLGDDAIVRRLRRHPLARAMRVDKLTLAALEATLVGPPSPIAQALAVTPSTLLARAEALAAAIGAPACAVVSTAAVGGGGAPGVVLDSAAVALPVGLGEVLRLGADPVLGHVEDGRLLLDLIAVPPEADESLAAIVRRALRPDPADPT